MIRLARWITVTGAACWPILLTPAVDQQAVFREGVASVFVNVSVTQGNVPVAGLGAEDFVVQDNGYGISVPKSDQTANPRASDNFAGFRNLRIFHCDGTDLVDSLRALRAAVRYVASQPWPFPSSLMIGCLAEATTEAITLDQAELADAAWFSRATVRAALAGPTQDLLVPPPFAIAHQLMRAWAGNA